MSRASPRSGSAMRCGPRPAARRRASTSRVRRAANGASASRPLAARTRRRAIGRSPERRSISTGAISRTNPRLSRELTEALIAEGKLPGILGNRHASGTVIIEEFGEEHVRTGKPICYTSAEFGVPDRRARGGFRARAALRALPHRAPALRSAQHRARHRAAVRRDEREGFRPHGQSQGFRRAAARRQSPAARRARRAAPSSRSARSATSSPIATPVAR